MLDFLDFLEIVLWSVYSTWKMAGSGRKSKKESERDQVLKAGQRTAGTGRCKRGSMHVRNLQRLNHVGYVILKSNVKLKR